MAIFDKLAPSQQTQRFRMQ